MHEQEKLLRKIDKILDDYFWLPSLETSKSYETTHDDNDGDPKSGVLTVTIGPDGDVWIKTHTKSPISSLRFRMPMTGGGQFHRIRNALTILAHAIKTEGKI